MTELPPHAWGDGAPGAAARDTLMVEAASPAWLRFHLGETAMPARAYLRLYPDGLDTPRNARVAVARIDPSLARLPRPSPPPRPSAVSPLGEPLRIPLRDAVRSARAQGGELVLELRALDAPIRLSSPRATDVRKQPRLELWWRRR